MLKIRYSLILLIVCSVSIPTRAQVVLSGDVASGTGSIEIEEALEFTITSTGNASVIVFQGWADAWDGTNTAAFMSPTTLNYKIFTTSQSTTLSHILDNNSYWVSQSVDLQSEDAYIYLSSGGFTVTSGWSIFIDPQTWSLATTANFNSNVSGSFSGNVYLADATGNRLSNLNSLAAVPEPSAYATIIGFVAAVVCIRRNWIRSSA